MDVKINLPDATEAYHNYDFDYEDDDDIEYPLCYCTGFYYRVKMGETICNRYTVERKLGLGNFSTVWLCWDQHQLHSVALKIMKTAPRITAAALLEIEFLKHTRHCDPDGSHKNKIVKLLDNFELNGTYGTHVCMVFELLGQDLLQCKGKKGLPLVNVKRIVKQVLEALDYLHTTCGIIHADIKPDNICWLSSAPEEQAVKLADLGNACWVDRHFSAIIQSSAYRCPEVLVRADYGASADIWSTACTAFELATGHFLFPHHLEESRVEDGIHMKRILKLLGGAPKHAIFELLTKKHGWGENEAAQFSEFLLPMVALDPNKRSSAKDALEHQWLHL